MAVARTANLGADALRRRLGTGQSVHRRVRDGGDRGGARLCQRFYADEVGRPGLPPGRYFRLLLIGYFEGLDAERAIAWRAADSFALREFLGVVLPEAPPDLGKLSAARHIEPFSLLLAEIAYSGSAGPQLAYRFESLS
jgi:Transposase domain (DUF772)